ncbi:MAG: hypothetical protein CMP09_10865 [Yangia sp.]|nr:hypothetical protein [Salipiger sp.]
MAGKANRATVVDMGGVIRREESPPENPEFSPAEIGAIAHLYRGEVYRCSVWRTRLDTTTNWAVVTLGVALSISYAAPDASPLPLVLVGVLNLFFLTLEARRYRYCDSWRIRFRTVEKNFYAPIIDPGQVCAEPGWRQQVAQDYVRPQFRISYLHALGRRIRRSYLWIMLIQLAAVLGKVAVPPTPVTSLDEAMTRADVGLIPGEVLFAGGILYLVVFSGLAIFSAIADRKDYVERDLPYPDAIY